MNKSINPPGVKLAVNLSDYSKKTNNVPKFVKANKSDANVDKSKLVSFDKFVLEIKHGCGCPFITTGFTISNVPNIKNEFVVVNERAWTPFASEKLMCDTLNAIINDTPFHTGLSVIVLPRVFSVSDGICNRSAFNKLAGLMISQRLIDSSNNQFSHNPKNLPSPYVLASNAKLHFGEYEDGKIYMRGYAGDPFGTKYELANISHEKFILIDPTSKEEFRGDIEDFDFYDDVNVNEFSVLSGLIHIARVSCDLEKELLDKNKSNTPKKDGE